MRTAISLGGRVVPVDIERTAAGFEATCTHRIGSVMRQFAGAAATYDGALAALRQKILTEPTPG
jgi:hypothetical protein